MGAELALIGLTVAKSFMDIKNAKSQAKATVEAGRIQAEQSKIQTLARAGQQKASFLSSGLTLEGTPLAALSSTYQTGQQDVGQIISNANNKSRNVIGQAYSSAIGNIAGAGMSMYGGGMFSTATAPVSSLASSSSATSAFYNTPALSTAGFDNFTKSSGSDFLRGGVL